MTPVLAYTVGLALALIGVTEALGYPVAGACVGAGLGLWMMMWGMT